MKNNNLVMVLGGGLLFLLGLVVGLLSAGGADVEDIDAAVAARLDAAAEAADGRFAALEASVGQLSTDVNGRLDELRTGVDTSTRTLGDVGTRLGGDLEGLGQSLSSKIETATASHLAALESGLAGLRGRISGAPAAPAAEGAGAPEAAAAAAGSDAAAEGYGPGQTAVLSDGALRVFVSRVDAEAGTARLQVNGTDMTLAAGESATLGTAQGECRVTLDAIGEGKAAVSGACGDALPAPEGTAPGTTVELAEGLRVFVSGVSGSGARIAINGVETRVVPVGEAVEVAVGEETCAVSVENIDRGHVALGYVCG